MFKKLRNSFLIINITIISIMMIASFAIIYFITANNIQAENRNKIDSVSTADQSGQADPAGSLALVVDGQGDIMDVGPSFGIPEETCRIMAEAAWKENKNYSTITIDGAVWMYTIEPNGNTKLSKLYGNGDFYDIVFLDVSDSSKTLSSLFTVFLLVGFCLLLVIAAISVFFANRAVKPVKEAWEKQEQFIINASHEFKTPLTIIKSNFNELKESWNNRDGAEDQCEWFDYIDVGIGRMTNLVNGLLTLLETENSDFDNKNIRFDVGKIVEGAILPMKAEAARKHISLSSAIEPYIMIDGDPETVIQVTTILLDNAVKYTNDKGWIEISLRKVKNYAVCSIKNSGEGIPQADMTKIFDRFYRADPSRSGKNNSFGLGLPIAKNIIERLGGKISADCEVDGTTVFTFSLKL